MREHLVPDRLIYLLPFGVGRFDRGSDLLQICCRRSPRRVYIATQPCRLSSPRGGALPLCQRIFGEKALVGDRRCQKVVYRVCTPRGIKNPAEDNKPSGLQRIELTGPEVPVAIDLLVVFVVFASELVNLCISIKRTRCSANLVRD